MKEWAKRWQCNTEVQDLEDSQCRNEELRSLEEGLQRLREGNHEKAARIQISAEVWSVTAFTPSSARHVKRN